jgi:hypothetical protein
MVGLESDPPARQFCLEEYLKWSLKEERKEFQSHLS